MECLFKTHPGNCTFHFCPQTTHHSWVTWPCPAAMDVNGGFIPFPQDAFCAAILSEMSFHFRNEMK